MTIQILLCDISKEILDLSDNFLSYFAPFFLKQIAISRCSKGLLVTSNNSRRKEFTYDLPDIAALINVNICSFSIKTLIFTNVL